MENEDRKQKGAGDCFPSPVYSEVVLAINFEDAKKHFLHPLLEIHYAHTLMLGRQKILSPEETKTLLRALDGLSRSELETAVYDGQFEDLFFYIEKKLANACGTDLAGKMHTARSRNDIDLTLYRMQVRREVLRIAREVLELRRILLELAARHINTIMPAYTHTQPAQPTTLAHYWMAAVEFLGRDFARLQAAFATVNRNPLGACAITTTGFPIDREYTTRLLGFEELQVNSYGAIAAIDYLTEAASAVAICMINLGKLVQDLLLWCTQEYAFLKLSDAYVQASSIMPQKRNPVSLEHTRILASKAFGQTQAILTTAHNTPFGDIVDSEDDLQPLVFNMFEDASRALRLFAALISKAEVDREYLRSRAGSNFLTVTELADTLVRRETMSFREAHHLVASAVKSLGCEDAPQAILDAVLGLAPEVIHRSLTTPREDLLQALDPAHFVAIRNIPGGPAPSAVQNEIDRTRCEFVVMQQWLDQQSKLLSDYPGWIREAVTACLAN